jgi:YidC/Oxa1 family membrane protein insertase
MALFKEHGVNPLAGCLPLLIQMPIFFALFGVLHKFVRNADGTYHPYAGLTSKTVEAIAKSKIFGVPIAATFNSSKSFLHDLNATPSTVKIVTVIMILLMMSTSFLTSRQMLARSKASGQQLDSAQAMTQKIMVYGMPLFFGVIGVNFQMGVLLYWLTTNVWTFGQQYFVIKAMGEDPEAVVRARKAKDGGTVVEGKATAAPAKGANLTKPSAGKSGTATSGTVGAAVPAQAAGSTGGTPRNGTGGTPARRPGQGASRPGNRKRKGGRH